MVLCWSNPPHASGKRKIVPAQVSLLGCAVCHFPISILSSHTTPTEPPGRWKLVNGKLVKRIFQRNENRIPFWATTARRTPSRIRVPQKKWRDVEQPPPETRGLLKARNGNVYLDWYCFERKIRVFVVEEVEALNTKRRQTESIKDPATSSNLSTHTTKPHANTYYLTDTIKLLLTDKFKKEQQTVRHNL